jgi:hypothetical protein
MEFKMKLIDKVLFLIRSHNFSNQDLEINKDTCHNVWLHLSAQKKLFDCSHGVFGKEFKSIKESVEGFGFIFIHLNNEFIIKKK